MDGFKYLENVSTLKLNAEACIGCGMCVDVCPHAVMKMVEKKVEIAQKDSCMECGACMRNCPVGALSVNAGVGCASAIIKGWLTGSEPSCGCGDGCC